MTEYDDATRAALDQNRKFFEEVALDHVNMARHLIANGHDFDTAWDRLYEYTNLLRKNEDAEGFTGGLTWIIGTMALALAGAIQLEKPADPRGWTYHVYVDGRDVGQP